MPERAPRLRFDRNELAGAFGDLGTDLPLVIGMILAARLDAAGVLTVFGLMQAAAGLFYGLPMPVQPLKAMAVLVIAQKADARTLYGGGLAIGAVMLLLTLTGLLERLAKIIPAATVRAVQLGLGLQLSFLALKEFVPAEGQAGLLMAAAAFALTLALKDSRRLPPALLLVGLGAAYALAFRVDGNALSRSFGLVLPAPRAPAFSDVAAGFFLLALPQMPLSLANAVLATERTAADLFPERPVTASRLGLTYSFMNLVAPFFGGIPACHGSGGMAGHYAFGARTGGSVVIEGLLYVIAGLFFSSGLGQLALFFPKPILGVILLFEGVVLMKLSLHSRREGTFGQTVLLGLVAAGLPYGYLIALVAGALPRCIGALKREFSMFTDF
jgi:hypothetical protein